MLNYHAVMTYACVLLVTKLTGVQDECRQMCRPEYCHVLVSRHRIWTDNWIDWTLIIRNYK
jgi:hypothetical protein